MEEILPHGTILHEKFRVDKMINAGSFGQIFRAIHIETGTEVAIKVAKITTHPHLVLEQQALLELKGQPRMPQLIFSGHTSRLNFIVMEMVGPNIYDLRKRLEDKRFSLESTVMVGIQVLEALECLDASGFVHRDVKPQNICVGRGADRNSVYLIDYGLARQIRMKDGSARKTRRWADFRGTVRYASVNAHASIELTAIDDLWSLFYTLLELGEGKLPWAAIKCKMEIVKMKKFMQFEHLTHYLPSSFDFTEMLRRFEDEGCANHNELMQFLEDVCPSMSDEFDWSPIE